jgi:hypothetical protein
MVSRRRGSRRPCGCRDARNGVVGSVAGAVLPPSLVLGMELYDRGMARRRQRASRAIEIAATCLGGLDILEERTANYDERVELLMRVLEAAGRTPLDAKVRALGRVLAEGVSGDGSIDQAFAMAAALDDMEASHVAALHHLAHVPTPPPKLRINPDFEEQGWQVRQLAAALPDLARNIDGVAAVLIRHGLMRAGGGVLYQNNAGPAVYRVAWLGLRCLFLLGDDEVLCPNGT